MILRVKVIPRSTQTEMAGQMADGTLKIKLAAAPHKGQANEALCEFLSRHHGVPRAAVRVISGHTAALKLVRVDV